MNLEAQLLKEHSKPNSQLIADFVSDNPETFPELMKLFLYGEYRVVQRAAWVIGILGELKPDLYLPYFNEFLECLNTAQHDAVKRNIYRTLQYIEIPEDYEGLFYDQALEDVISSKSATAVKVFGMTVAYSIAIKYPEMYDELALVIEQQMPLATKGFSSRGRKFLKRLRK